MNDKEFNTEISRGLSGGYLLYGDEEYLKNHYIKKAVSSVITDPDLASFNLVECDENSFSPAALADALATMPMMSDKVMVVFRVRISQLREKDKAALYEVLSELDKYPQTVLLLVACKGYFDAGAVRKNKPSAIYKKLTEHLVPVEFEYRTGAVLKKWIARHFEADGVTAGADVIDRIISVAGADMCSLTLEIEKLSCYALSTGSPEVTMSSVEMLCSDSGETETFALSNAIVAGDRAAALAALRVSRDKRRRATEVLSMITSDFTNMMKVSVYMEAGIYKDEIAKRTGIHPFKVSKYMDAVASSEQGRIRAALERCRDADAALKSSRIDYIALERLICTMPSRKQRGKYGAG